jgi:hypothetical protein
MISQRQRETEKEARDKICPSKSPLRDSFPPIRPYLPNSVTSNSPIVQ